MDNLEKLSNDLALDNLEEFSDDCILYYSLEDAMWVAHGLRTDQVALGDTLLEALADFIKVIGQLVALAAHESDIRILSEAPEEIQKMVVGAKPLSDRLLWIASDMACNLWTNPEIAITASQTQRYTIKVYHTYKDDNGSHIS